MKGSGIILAVIIGIIVIGVVLGFMGNPDNRVMSLNENIVSNKQVETTVKNNNVDNTENKDNNIENTENTENAAQNTEVTEENKEDKNDNKTDTEKAIDIVKLDLGTEAENKNITVDSVTSDGKYVISVREKNTTQALAFYTVNVNDKTFTKKEMY